MQNLSRREVINLDIQSERLRISRLAMLTVMATLISVFALCASWGLSRADQAYLLEQRV